MAASLSSVRTVLRQFRYAVIPPAIGRRFSVTSHETLLADLGRFGNELAVGATLLYEDVEDFYRQIAKYGILDLQFAIHPEAVTSECRRGKSILRELGFGPESAARFAKVWPEFGGMMADIAANLEENRWYLMLFAKITGGAVTGRPLVDSIRAARDWTKLPLPAEFEVVDACVTNTAHAWSSKHFYF